MRQAIRRAAKIRPAVGGGFFDGFFFAITSDRNQLVVSCPVLTTLVSVCGYNFVILGQTVLNINVRILWTCGCTCFVTNADDDGRW